MVLKLQWWIFFLTPTHNYNCFYLSRFCTSQCWFVHKKHDKIILPSFPLAVELPGVRRTGFWPLVIAAYHWKLLLFCLCPCRLLHFKSFSQDPLLYPRSALPEAMLGWIPALGGSAHCSTGSFHLNMHHALDTKHSTHFATLNLAFAWLWTQPNGQDMPKLLAHSLQGNTTVEISEKEGISIPPLCNFSVVFVQHECKQEDTDSGVTFAVIPPYPV